jgi:hypothetical protein
VRNPDGSVSSAVEEEDLWDDDIDEAEYYDKGTRTMRDKDGGIVTKHNALVNGRRNRQKMETDFPIGFARWVSWGLREA